MHVVCFVCICALVRAFCASVVSDYAYVRGRQRMARLSNEGKGREVNGRKSNAGDDLGGPGGGEIGFNTDT